MPNMKRKFTTSSSEFAPIVKRVKTILKPNSPEIHTENVLIDPTTGIELGITTVRNKETNKRGSTVVRYDRSSASTAVVDRHFATNIEIKRSAFKLDSNILKTLFLWMDSDKITELKSGVILQLLGVHRASRKPINDPFIQLMLKLIKSGKLTIHIVEYNTGAYRHKYTYSSTNIDEYIEEVKKAHAFSVELSNTAKTFYGTSITRQKNKLQKCVDELEDQESLLKVDEAKTKHKRELRKIQEIIKYFIKKIDLNNKNKKTIDKLVGNCHYENKPTTSFPFSDMYASCNENHHLPLFKDFDKWFNYFTDNIVYADLKIIQEIIYNPTKCEKELAYLKRSWNIQKLNAKIEELEQFICEYDDNSDIDELGEIIQGI